MKVRVLKRYLKPENVFIVKLNLNQGSITWTLDCSSICQETKMVRSKRPPRNCVLTWKKKKKKKKKHCCTWKESWSFRSLAILVIMFFVLFVLFYFKHALMYCTIRQHQNVSEYPRISRYLSPGEAGGGGWSIFLPSRYNLPKLWKRICNVPILLLLIFSIQGALRKFSSQT